MDIKDIRKIIELMKDNELSEFEVEEEGFRLSLRRHSGQVVQSAAPPPATAPAPTPAAETAPSRQEVPEFDDTCEPVNSPMVGTFYRSPEPEADAFISVGDQVDEDTVVCIIEAMKVMNEIKAEVSGELVEILVENGEAVEFGQPLFLLRTDG